MMLPHNQLGQDTALYIREMQGYLRKLAQYDPAIPLITPDGIFGDETTGAVAAFQQSAHLPVTGQIDAATGEAITAAYEHIRLTEAAPVPVQAFPGPTAVLRSHDAGDAVCILQILLSSLSSRFANIPPVPFTGEMDDTTAAAVRQLQRCLSLPATGEVDCATWDGIATLYNVG